MNNTIFDDVFRTMIEKMPYLAVPLINEVFWCGIKKVDILFSRIS